MSEDRERLDFLIDGLRAAAGMLYGVWPHLDEQDVIKVTIIITAFMDTLDANTKEAQMEVMRLPGPDRPN